MTKLHKNCIFSQKNLVMSKKSSTFAPDFEKNGPLAQLNRVPHYGCGGCRFESCMDHKAKNKMRLRIYSQAHFYFLVCKTSYRRVDGLRSHPAWLA